MVYPESIRDALPKGESYPVTRTALESALRAAGVEQLDLVYFLRWGIEEWRDSGSGRVLSVIFRAATRDWGDRTQVRVHAVPSNVKASVRAALPPVIEKAAAWIRAAERSENVWRSTDHHFTVRWADDSLVTSQG